MSAHIHVTDEDGVRIVRINRPDKKNALTAGMYDADGGGVDQRQALAPAVHCVVIAGVKGAFCAGNDLEEFRQAAESGEGLERSRASLSLCPRLQREAAGRRGERAGHRRRHDNAAALRVTSLPRARPVSSRRSSISGFVPEAASSLLAPRLMGPRRALPCW